MKTGARIAIGTTALVSAAGFALIGFKMGQAFPNGPMPFYVLAVICGAIGGACFLIRSRSQPAPKEAPEGEYQSDQAGMNLDLSRLTISGWLLLLSSFGMAIVTVVVIVGFFNDALQERGPLKIAGLIAFGLASGFFVVGKLFLAKLGLPIFRS